MADQIFIDVTGGGIVATHPERPEAAVAVAPTDKDKVNTIRIPLIAVACFLIPDHFFDFDSSVVHADAQDPITKFIELRRTLADTKLGAPPLSIFGHTDPVGDVFYNMQLGWRRARSIYGLLIHDIDIWESLYFNALGGDVWGRRSLQMMLNTVTDSDGNPFYAGPVDGAWTQKWADSIKKFQTAKSVKVTGSLGSPEERVPVFDAYMTFLCVDAKGQPFTLDRKADFLARGADADGKGDLQGCSKFNLQMIFAANEQLSEAQRNKENAVNRRVVVFAFKPGAQVKPDKWPCPAAANEKQSAQKMNAAVSACQDRFWSDADQRGESHKLADQRRTFRGTAPKPNAKPGQKPQPDKKPPPRENTFQCRFYHGFAVNSPCEDVVKLWKIRVATRGAHDELVPLANKSAVVAMGKEGNAMLLRTTSNKDGFLFLPVIEGETQMKLQLDAFDAAGTVPPGKDGGSDEDPAESLFVPLILDGDVLVKMPDAAVDESDDQVKLACKQRLHNLGYGPGSLDAWDEGAYRAALVQFKKRVQGVVNPDDKADAATRDALVQEHGS